MAAVIQPTRPRLQAINQSFSDLNEQIRQAAHIIGLPDDWISLEEVERSAATQRLVRARADWVIRWILEKFKDSADAGTQARASPTVWKLLDCMVHVLPISRCAPHLRDAHFPTILEQTLQENFGTDVLTQLAPEAQDSRSSEVSESSETVQEDPQPSRKRKRGAAGTSTISQRASLEANGPAQLFDAVRAVVESIRSKAGTQHTGEGLAQSEHMNMVLKTESAQAARILKCWFIAVQRLTVDGSEFLSAGLLNLSPVIDLWELRTTDAKADSGSSVEQFGTECLIPALLLSQSLRQANDVNRVPPESAAVLQTALLGLDRLLVGHVISPSRVAFVNQAIAKTPQADSLKSTHKALISSSLEPLRAMLLQAAQIGDAGQSIPPSLRSLFTAVPQLLDLVIRSSPARTPKSRTAEKPWIQAAFVALAESMGCSLGAPEFETPGESIAALEQCLSILAAHNVSLNSAVLKDLFWFHSGLKFPLKGRNVVHWSLVAALLELDSGVFIADPNTSSHTIDDRPEDLATFLFDEISAIGLSSAKSVGGAADPGLDYEAHLKSSLSRNVESPFGTHAIVQRIVVPIMTAFAHNRSLLTFLGRWDAQLCKTARRTGRGSEEQHITIWQDRGLALALASLLEQSLTVSQISRVVQEHSKRLQVQAKPQKDFSPEAFSSTIIMQAILQSLNSDEVLEALKPHLQSLWNSYKYIVQPDRPATSDILAVAWVTLCQLLVLLWPMYLHGSATAQEDLLHPLVEQASREVSSVREVDRHRHVDSGSRAAAMTFLLTACDCLRSLPHAKVLIGERLRQALKSLSPDQFEGQDLSNMMEILCAEYSLLLETIEPDTLQASIYTILSTLSVLEKATSEPIVDAFSQSVFTNGSASLQSMYTASLLEATAQDGERLFAIAVRSFLQLTPLSIAREQREAVLDKLTALIQSRSQDICALLSVMVHLMEVPNATAKVSSDGAAFFDMAQRLHDAKLESTSALQLLQELVKSTLSHMLPNKDQEQNLQYLKTFRSTIESVLKKPQKCSAARLAVLRGTFLAFYEENVLLPVHDYFTLLIACLQGESISDELILSAFNEIPTQTTRTHEAVFATAQTALREWTSSKLPLDNHLDPVGIASYDSFTAQFWIVLHETVSRYHLYPNVKWLLGLSSGLLRENLPAKERWTVLQTFKTALIRLEPTEKFALVTWCLSGRESRDSSVDQRLLHTLITALEDKLGTGSELKEQQLAMLPTLSSLLGQSPDNASFNALLDAINTIIRDKPSLTTQYSIECVLAALLKLTSRNSPRLSGIHAPAIFKRLCETSRLILLLHRGRLGGRFHLLLPLLQGLLLCLFIPNAGRGAALPPWLGSSSPSNAVRLTPANASQYTRLISALCSPTQSSVQRHFGSRSQASSSKKELNDPVKAAREYTSQYVYPLLSSYCRFQLNGRLDPQVREKLTPGLLDLVDVGSLDRGSVDAMFAGLPESERDIWKEVWGAWERGRTGGKKFAREAA